MRRPPERARPVFESVRSRIDAILAGSAKSMQRKQRLTATQLRWEEVAGSILGALRDVVPIRAAPGGRMGEITEWKVVRDRSCGWEVNSRVLVGVDGVREVVAALDALSKVAPALRVGHSVKTSTHVHLGWRADVAAMSRLMEIVAYFEPALVSLVEPHRPHSPYCQSIAGDLTTFRANQTVQDWKSCYSIRSGRRDRVVSLKSLLGGFGTVEVRLHHGTFDATELIPWLALWMCILRAAESRSRLPMKTGWDPSASRDASKRRSLSALCRFVQADPVLERCLVATRDELAKNWAGRQVPMPRQRNRATVEAVMEGWAEIRARIAEREQLLERVAAAQQRARRRHAGNPRRR